MACISAVEVRWRSWRATMLPPRCAFDGVNPLRVKLARVMTQVNENDDAPADQIGRRAGDRTQDLREQAGTPDARTAARLRPRAWAVGHTARRPGRAAGTRSDDAGRARGAREGAAALHDQGDRGP